MFLNCPSERLALFVGGIQRDNRFHGLASDTVPGHLDILLGPLEVVLCFRTTVRIFRGKNLLIFFHTRNHVCEKHW